MNGRFNIRKRVHRESGNKFQRNTNLSVRSKQFYQLNSNPKKIFLYDYNHVQDDRNNNRRRGNFRSGNNGNNNDRAP